MSFSAGSKKSNDVSLIIPFVDHLQGVRIKRTIHHTLRLLIWDVIAYSPIDIDQEVLDLFWQERTQGLTLFIINVPQGMVVVHGDYVFRGEDKSSSWLWK